MKVYFLLFSLACLADLEVLKKQNSILVQALDDITEMLEDAEGGKKDEVDRDILGPAKHCMDLNTIPVSFDGINKKYPCLKDYCASIKTAEECHQNENYLHGCSWCSGSCKPYMSYQEAFIQCVRLAYKDHNPDQVNGKTPPLRPWEAAFDITFFNEPIGKPGHAGLPYVGNMRWAFSTASRNKGDRVPIHVHPFSGMSCITTHNGDAATIVWAEGEETKVIPTAKCYTMPPLTKLAPYNPSGGYTVLDTFQWNACYPIWVIIEPGAEWIQDKQFIFESDLDCDDQCNC